MSKMTLNKQYAIGLVMIGFKRIETRSTKFEVFEGTTSQLYNIDPTESNDPRYVFVSTRGSSLRVGISPRSTDYTMPVHPKVKNRLIALANQ